MILFGASKLANAINKGDNARLRDLLQRGVDPDAHEQYGEEPLERALKTGNIEAATILLEYGAKQMRFQYGQETILFYAIEHGYHDFAKAFIEKRPESLTYPTYQGGSPLHVAASSGNLKVAEFLLENGADPEHKDRDNRTALYLAEKSERTEVVALLKAVKPVTRGIDEWKKTDDSEIAHIVFQPLTGLRITDIFNFTRSERRVICLDETHGTQSSETKPFDQCSLAALQEASDNLARQGGLKNAEKSFFPFYKG